MSSNPYPLNVYVVARADGPCKIGMSDNPQKRIGALRGGRTKLTIAGTYPRQDGDARLVERVAHQLLAAKHLGGEWFDVTEAQAIGAVQEAIRLVDCGDPAIHAPESTDIRMAFQATEELVRQIDDWRFANRVATRADAIRRLVIAALAAAAAEETRAPKPRKAKS